MRRHTSYGGRARELGSADFRFDMRAELGSLRLGNPIFTASGCAGMGRELSAFVKLSSLGGFVTPSLTLKPRPGLAAPRSHYAPSGILHANGLPGLGVEQFIDQELPWLVQRGVRVIASIAGQTPEECMRVASKLRSAGGFEALEVNASGQGLGDAGSSESNVADWSAQAVSAVRRASDPRMPIFAKLSADFTDVVEVASAVINSGVAGLTLVNSVQGMAVDLNTMRPALAGSVGGLSGPAIRPIAVASVWRVRSAFPEIPIIGSGGIRSGRDALEFVLAGAQAVSIGSAIFADPSAPTRISSELATQLHERGFQRFADAVGYAHRDPDVPIPEPVSPSDVPPSVSKEPEVSEARISGVKGEPAGFPDDAGGLADWDFITENPR